MGSKSASGIRKKKPRTVRQRQPRTSTLSARAAELRAALPKLWSCRGQSSHAEGRRVLRLPDVRAWLRSPAASSSLKEWGSNASDNSLRRVLRLVASKACLQRLGIRFQDPSKHGTWEVSNLKGYSETRLGRLPQNRGSEVSWHSYLACFRLRLGDGSGDVAVERSVVTKVLSTRIEKRRRGESRQLASERFHVTAHSRRQQAVDRRKRIKVVQRPADLLPAVIMRPVSTGNLPQYTLIFLHGMGEVAMRYAERPHYFNDGTAAVKVIIPTAPLREVSCFDSWWSKVKSKDGGGHRWRLEKFNSWYDYTSNHGGKKEDTIDVESLHCMQRSLHQVIEREAIELRGRTDRILLGGKSQGCVTALDAALTFPKRLGGFIGLVGHVLSCTPVDGPGGVQAKTPLHFYHEVEDDIMQWHWVQREEQRLRKAGHNVRSFRCKDPEGNGHFVGGIEGAWIRKSLRLICASGSSS
eukprot:TRINITY_DN41241_c0_g1_i1.p1 TRINITY_DN41241_c0_g1~~TRINITY_DN41241_c0_g1_i1.p1  ORF type:complete len:492 (-),score=90.35 TRINITY_DN41241_c0_g1_i1:23-1426(-)